MAKQPPNIIAIYVPNISHLPILPNPEPNTPVTGIPCNIIAGNHSFPASLHSVLIVEYDQQSIGWQPPVSASYFKQFAGQVQLLPIVPVLQGIGLGNGVSTIAKPLILGSALPYVINQIAKKTNCNIIRMVNPYIANRAYCKIFSMLIMFNEVLIILIICHVIKSIQF